MVAPTITHYSDPEEDYGLQVGRYRRSLHCKSRPRFIVPTPYRVSTVLKTDREGDPSWQYQLPVTILPCYTHYQEGNGTPGWATSGDLYNTVYGRLVSQIREDATSDNGGTAELGAAMVEYRKTVNFVEDKAVALDDYITNIGNAKRIPARDKLLRAQGKKWTKPETLARLRGAAFRERWAIPRWLGTRWLEAWMVIAPTLGDVSTSLQVLSRDLPLGRVRRTARTSTTGSTSTGGTMRRKGPWSRTQRLALQAQVSVSNPNLYLAQSLGVLNPAVILGQVTPWSWLVGWFVNWENYLSQWTDFAGVRVEHPVISYSSEMESQQAFLYYGVEKCSATFWSRYYGRVTPSSLPGVTLSVSLPGRLSISRAATSISLIVNKLTQR